MIGETSPSGTLYRTFHRYVALALDKGQFKNKVVVLT